MYLSSFTNKNVFFDTFSYPSYILMLKAYDNGDIF